MSEPQKKPWDAVFGPVIHLSDGKVGDQDVRRALVRIANTQNKVVRATVWPNFEAIPLSQGDWVGVEGPLEAYEGTNQSGQPQTYWNISVKRLTVLSSTAGSGAPPKKAAPKANEDESPF